MGTSGLVPGPPPGGRGPSTSTTRPAGSMTGRRRGFGAWTGRGERLTDSGLWRSPPARRSRTTSDRTDRALEGA